MEWISDKPEVIVNEVEVFKYQQHHTGRNYTDHQEHLFRFTLRSMNSYRREIIDQNGDQQYKNVDGHKTHVKETACCQ